MTKKEFWADSFKKWNDAIIDVVGQKPADSSSWYGYKRIESAIKPFLGKNLNHALLPNGGGFDFLNVEQSAEENCLSFSIDERMAEITRPISLTLEYFPDFPEESFLFLELGELKPRSKYALNDPSLSYEEVFEYPSGIYDTRDIWEQGYLRHDEQGHEIPLPATSRLVTRRFGGKILLVSKGSLWNQASATYDGRHNNMTSIEIRKIIENIKKP